MLFLDFRPSDFSIYIPKHKLAKATRKHIGPKHAVAYTNPKICRCCNIMRCVQRLLSTVANVMRTLFNAKR